MIFQRYRLLKPFHILLSLLAIAAAPSFAANHLVQDLSFADPDLKACILSANPAATVADTTFIQCNQFISDIGGIEALVNLENLDLNTNPNTNDPDRNTVTDLSPLLPLLSLSQLHVNGNEVGVIPALAGIVGLNIGNNPVTDFAGIGAMTQLDSVWLDNLNIDELTLAGLLSGKPLTHLGLGGTQVQNLGFLSGFAGLVHLDLWATNLTDVSALSDLTLLQFLNISDSSVSDVQLLTTEVATLINLNQLYLNGLAVSDLSFLSSLTQLTTLGLGGTKVQSLGPLSVLTGLLNLELFGTSLTDVSVLSDLTQLQYLNLDWSRVNDLSLLTAEIATLINLDQLNLSGLAISDLAFLSGLTKLRAIYLSNNAISDITALAALTQLESVGLAENALNDADLLSLAAGLANLTFLDVNQNLFTTGSQGDLELALIISGNGDISNYHNNPKVARISLASFAPLAVDLDQGDQAVSLNVSAFHPDSVPIDSTCINFTNPSNTAGIGTCYAGASGSGDLATIDYRAERGDWAMTASVQFAGVYEGFTTAQLAELGIAPVVLQVAGTGPGDSTPPVLTSFSLSTTSVDIDSSPSGYVVLEISLGADDGAGSGVSQITVELYNPATDQVRYVYFGPGETQRNVIFSTVDGGGEWQVALWVNDFAGTSTYVPSNQLNQGSISVTNTQQNSGIPVSGLTFNDAALQACVQAQATYVHELTYLNCNEGVSDLTGVEQLFALDSLDLSTGRYLASANTVTNIAPVALLPVLSDLNLADNQVSDLSSLSGLSLRNLTLAFNPVTDLGPVYAMTSLTYLDVNGVRSVDLLQVSSLVNLSGLVINDIGFGVDLTPILGLPLTNLEACSLGISDLSFLAFYPKLSLLNLCDNLITDISDLAGMSVLRTLQLDTNRISDISPLAGLNLQGYLGLERNLISDVTPLQNMVALTGLSLHDNRVVDVTPLGALTNVEYLNLDRNRILDASPLGDMTNLRSLQVSQNGISEVSWLNSLTLLDWLWIEGNLLDNDDITFVEGLTGVIFISPLLRDKPTVNQVTFSATTLVMTADQTLDISVDVSGSNGNNLQYYCLVLSSPGGIGELSGCRDTNDTSPITFNLPATAARGEWSLQINGNTDNGYWRINAPGLSALGLDAFVDIQGTGLGDYKPPRLNDFTVGSAILDIGLAGAGLTLSTDAADLPAVTSVLASSGISGIEVGATGAAPDYSTFRSASLDIGSQTGEMQIFTNDPVGQWRIDWVRIADNAGNSAWIDTTQLSRFQLADGFEVIAPSQDDDDADGFNNGQELLQGTDPNNDAHYPGSAGQISMVSELLVAGEDDGFVDVKITRMFSSAGSVSVDYATGVGTAQANIDYSSTSGTLTWANGDASTKVIQVPLIDNNDLAASTTVTVLLSNVSGGGLLGSDNTKIVIADKDYVSDGSAFAGAVSLNDYNIHVAEDAGTGSFRVGRRASSQGAISVDYVIESVAGFNWESPATGGTDFVAGSGTINWADGDQAIKEISFSIIDDASAEFTESFSIRLLNPAGGTYIQGSDNTLVFISDDDRAGGAGVIGLANRSVLVSESDGQADITINRTYGGEGAASLLVYSSDGSATADFDFERNDCCETRFDWLDGDMTPRTYSVSVFDDTLDEGTENFVVVLLNAGGNWSFERSETTFAIGLPVILDDQDDADLTTDTDGDGAPDAFDLDDDDDGVRDWNDFAPRDASEQADSDGDGVGDNRDAFPFDPAESEDSDYDGVGNNSDAFPFDRFETVDADGDGVGDNADPFPNDPSESSDIDGDSIGDNADPDIDGDGLNNDVDLAPADAAINTFTALTPAGVRPAYISVTEGALADPTIRIQTVNGETLRFDQSGSGSISTSLLNAPTTWLIDTDGSLMIDYGIQEVRDVSVFTLLSSGVINQAELDAYTAVYGNSFVQIQQTFRSIRRFLLVDGPVQDDFWQVTTEDFYVVDDAQRQLLFGDIAALPREVTYDGAKVSALVADDLAMIPIALPGLSADIALSTIPGPGLQNNTGALMMADLLTLNSDGTGSFRLSGDLATWQVLNGQLIVDVAQTGLNIIFTQYETQPVGSLYYAEATIDGKLYTNYSYAVQDTGSNDISAMLGSFLQNSFSLTNPDYYDADGNLRLDTVFGFILNTDNTVTRIYDLRPTINGPLGSDLWFWNQDVSGEIVLQAYRNNTSGYSDCDPAFDPTCFKWRERHWFPLSVAGNRLYVLEWAEITSTFDPADPQLQLYIYPRIQFYEIFDQDTDGDGVSDVDEIYGNTNPYVNPLDRDVDDDQIADVIEQQLGFLNPFNPFDAAQDEDGDGISNLREIRAGTDPADNSSVPGAGYLSFTYGNSLVEESDGSVSVQVRRLWGDVGAISVEFATADGSALAGTDYTGLSTVLNWADGDSSPRILSIPVIDNAAPERLRIFSMSLANPTGGAGILRDRRIAQVADDDSDAQGLPFAGTLSVVEFSTRVAESEGYATFTVDRGESASGVVSVDYVVSSQSAFAGEDFEGISGTLTWADGDQSPQSVTVTLFDDYDLEPVEIVQVRLENPSPDAYITNGFSTIEIIDEEALLEPAPVGPVARRVRAEESDGPVSFRFIRLGDGAGPVTLEVAFPQLETSNAATAGVDFDPTPQSVTWLDGETGVREIAVPYVDDLIRAENLELFIAGVSYPPGVYNLEPPGNTVALIWDVTDIDGTTDSDADGVVDDFELDDDGDAIIDFGDNLVNRYPVSRDDPLFETFKNTPVTAVMDIAQIAADPNGDAVQIRTNTLQTANGSLSGLGDGLLFVDGAFTYQPNTGFIGLDMFDYFLCDKRGCAGPFVASMSVLDRTLSFATELSDVSGLLEDDPGITVDVAGPFGADFAAIEDVLFAGNSALIETYSISGGELTLNFAPDQNGIVNVSVLASNSFGEIASSTFAVTVTPVADAPTVVGDGVKDVVGFEGADAVKLDLSQVFNDPDTEDVLIYQVTSSDPAIANVVLSEGSRFDVAYGGTLGQATVTLGVSDNGGASFVTNTFTVTVERVNVAGIVGPNVNVIGPTYANPLYYADKNLKQQNEVECVTRPDNNQHLFCQYNDYRGAEDVELVGDSWQGVSMSRDGGLTWVSRLAPGWKGYPSPIKRELADGSLEPGGFAADPMVVAVPGAVLSSFIVSDRQVKGPGGLYMQRWFEQNAEAGQPWRVQSESLRIAKGDNERFIDKGDLAVALTPGADPISITAGLELDAETSEVVTRELPAANLVAAYTIFNSAPDPDAAGFERGITFDSPPFEYGDFQLQPAAEGWDVDAGDGQVSIFNPFTESNGALSIAPNNFGSAMHVATPVDWSFDNAGNVQVDIGFDFLVNGLMPPGIYSVDLGDQIGISIRLTGSVGEISYVGFADDGSGYLGTVVDPFEVSPDTWHRLAFRLDFKNQSADVFLDGRIIAAGLPFEQAAVAFNGVRFSHPGGAVDTVGPLHLDNLSVKAKTTTSAEIWTQRSTDYGETWTDLNRISNTDDENNTGVSLAMAGDTVLAVWRRFATPTDIGSTDAIMYAMSTDGGINFGSAQVLGEVCAFDQFSSGAGFRTNGFAKAVSNGSDFYVFWADRNYAQVNAGETNPCDNGFARIVMSSLSPDPSGGPSAWSDPVVMDDEEGLFGHQVMPDAFAVEDKVQVVWYDTRYDESATFDLNIKDSTNGQEYVLHTVDVRAARLIDGVPKPSIQVTQYKQGLTDDGQLVKLERSHPNARIFRKGTTPFIGDYISVTGPSYSLDANGVWRQYDLGGQEPAFFVAWADNRDVRGDVWIDFVQPTRFSPPGFNADSEADPTGELLSCSPDDEIDRSLTRDQNIYGSMIQPAFKLSSPSILKPTDEIQRGFVLYLQNFTNATTSYTATIVNQPPDSTDGGRASFSEFPLPPFAAGEGNPVTTTEVVLPARSAAVKMVYITSLDPQPAITVQVVESDCTDCEVASLILNGNPIAPEFADAPDSTNDDNILSQEIRAPDIQTRLIARTVENPGFENPGFENPGFENPGFENPGFENPGFENPGFENPGFENPGYQNPGFENVDIQAPGFENPGFENPGFENPGFENPGFENPGFENPGFENPGFENPGFENETFEFSSLFNSGLQNPSFEDENFDRFTDVTWEVKNNGNTAGSIALKPFLEEASPETQSQLLVTKTYALPTIQNCEPGILASNQVLVNIANPDLTGDASVEAGTVFIEPGETLIVTLRVFEKAPEVTEEPLPPAPGEDPPPPLPEPEPEPPAPVPELAGIAITSQTCGELSTCDEDNPTPPPIIDGVIPEPRYFSVKERVILTESLLVDDQLSLTYQNVSDDDIRGAFRVVINSANLQLLNGEGQTDDGREFITLLPLSTDIWVAGNTLNVILLFDGSVLPNDDKDKDKDKEEKCKDKTDKEKEKDKDCWPGLVYDVELQRKAPAIGEI